MKKGNVLFRVDGNQQIGLGHLVRCLALAQMLSDEFEISFFCKAIPAILKNNIEQYGFKSFEIIDEKEFLDFVKAGDLVVLDGYHFDTSFQYSIRNKGARLICIDDVHDKRFHADLVINHSPGISAQEYLAEPFTQFALGLDFVLLRQKFLEAALRSEVSQKRKDANILICFGGADHKNLTGVALQVLRTFSEFERITVITGPSYPYRDELADYVQLDSRVTHLHALGEDEIIKNMIAASVAIIPASGILLEVIAVGCTPISGCYIDNQKFLYQNLRSANAFLDAKDFSYESIKQAITEYLGGSKFNKKKLVDGLSGQRVRKAFLQLVQSNRIRLKQAGIEDVDVTYKWASSAEVRKYSFTQGEIKKNDHEKWFVDKISRPDCLYFLAFIDGKPVGSIRFDVRDGTDAVLSYLIDPDYHGRSLGTLMLAKGIEEITKNANFKNLKTISGSVMPQNIASLKTFGRFGFKKSEANNIVTFTIPLNR